MEKATKEIKALDMYYEVARKEYDDTHSYYDGIDGKATVFITISIAVPSILLSIVQIPPGIDGRISFGLYSLGFLMLIWVFYRIIRALGIRTVKFGSNLDEFQEACKDYENEAIKEAVADAWLEAAKENHKKASDKATELRGVHLPFYLEMLFFVGAAIVALAAKL